MDRTVLTPPDQSTTVPREPWRGFHGQRWREVIVGLQTDAPLKRAIMPNGGWRVVETSPKTYRCAMEHPENYPQLTRTFHGTL